VWGMVAEEIAARCFSIGFLGTKKAAAADFMQYNKYFLWRCP